MDRRGLTELISDRTGLSMKDVDTVIKALPPAILDSLRDGKKVHLRGFGTFYPRKLKPGSVRVPNGSRLSVAARVRLAFRAGRSTPERLNPNPKQKRGGRP